MTKKPAQFGFAEAFRIIHRYPIGVPPSVILRAVGVVFSQWESDRETLAKFGIDGIAFTTCAVYNLTMPFCVTKIALRKVPF